MNWYIYAVNYVYCILDSVRCIPMTYTSVPWYCLYSANFCSWCLGLEIYFVSFHFRQECFIGGEVRSTRSFIMGHHPSNDYCLIFFVSKGFYHFIYFVIFRIFYLFLQTEHKCGVGEGQDATRSTEPNAGAPSHDAEIMT